MSTRSAPESYCTSRQANILYKIQVLHNSLCFLQLTRTSTASSYSIRSSNRSRQKSWLRHTIKTRVESLLGWLHRLMLRRHDIGRSPDRSNGVDFIRNVESFRLNAARLRHVNSDCIIDSWLLMHETLTRCTSGSVICPRMSLHSSLRLD